MDLSNIFMPELLTKIALIGAAGIGAQWIAWKLRIPAIAVLLLTGAVLGPLTGIINPAVDFGEFYKPAIALAVAIILFEGGLTLNFREIRETNVAVRRIILIGGPLVWTFSTLAAHYAAGLSWPAAAVLGAILVITGPTVIMPLLRQAQLGHRPASLLRWEAIVNDPIGALLAVIAFETFLVLHGDHGAVSLVLTVLVAAAIALVGGYVAGRALAFAFVRGYVPEFLKSPVVLVSVLFVYAVSDIVLEESGLLTVTVMGITLANSRIASLTDMRRFKETVTVLLVSGLFIMLTASFDVVALTSLGWGAVIFVLAILFVVRPVAIGLATIGSGLNWRERALTAWIAPRGIVAVAVAGLFGNSLVNNGVADGAQMTALAFVVVASTIILHGFSLGPLAKLLKLKSAERPGILIVGGSGWSEALAEKLQMIEVPVLIADSNWNHIRNRKLAGIRTYFGEILSEGAHHSIAFNQFSHLIAATDNDAYNSLVCTEFGPEMGRSSVFQIGKVRDEEERSALAFTLGGRPLFRPGKDYSEMRREMWNGWAFTATKLTEEFDFNDFQETRPKNTVILLWVDGAGLITFEQGRNTSEPAAGDTIISFGPPAEGTAKAPNAKRMGKAPSKESAAR